jgi:predicted nucleic acid-binding protein
MQDKKFNMTIVFYTSISRLFRTTTIGHLYELSQLYDVIVVSEKLDSYLLNLINDKKLFPRVKKVISINTVENLKVKLLFDNLKWRNLANSIINEFNPDIVVVDDDIYPFEMYLLRFAKKSGAIRLAIQSSLKAKARDVMEYSLLIRAYSKNFKFIPLPARLLIIKITRIFYHFFIYWVLPVSIGEAPFFGDTSFINSNYTVGKRSLDFYAVFSDKYLNILKSEGVDGDKLIYINHPLETKTKYFFDRYFFKKSSRENKIITLFLPPANVGIRRADKSVIHEDIFYDNLRETMDIIINTLMDWSVQVKIHPNISDKYFLEIKNIFSNISKDIIVLNPKSSTEECIVNSDIIIAPAPASTVLYIASIRRENKIIISTDFENEINGDLFKDYIGINYIDKKDKLKNVLEDIYNNQYKNISLKVDDSGFSNIVDLVKFLLIKKYS